MARFSEQFIHQVQQAVDIVDLVSQYVALKKAGKEFVGLCPFHQDHKPSMFVSPAKQIFKCFACGAGGSVFQFLQLYEKIAFPEAVKLLAERANIPIPQDNFVPAGPPDLSKPELAKLMIFAARFFRSQLQEEGGRAALEYARNRGLTEESIQRFGLGYAPDAWEALLGAAKRAGFREPQLLAAGLAIQREGTSGCYDRFRNRLMFPIIDPASQVIAFGGRALAAEEKAKYINSPETILFDKSSNLYALNWSRDGISGSGQAVVVEGYLDAILPLQSGLNNVVATLGTALTERHVRLLSRYAKEVVLIFDADAAGQMATERALEVFLTQRLHVRVAVIPEGKDPCDYCLSQGGEALKNLIAAAPDALQYYWSRKQAALAASGGNLADRRRVVEEFLRMVVSSSAFGAIDEIRRGQLAQHIGHILNISPGDLQRQMQRLARTIPRPGASAVRPAAPGSGETSARAQRHLLEVLLNRADLFDSISHQVGPDDFDDERFAAIARALWASAGAGRGSLNDLTSMEQLADLGGLLAELALDGERRGNYEPTLAGAVEQMLEQRARREQQQWPSEFDDQTLREIQRRRGPAGTGGQPDPRRIPKIT